MEWRKHLSVVSLRVWTGPLMLSVEDLGSNLRMWSNVYVAVLSPLVVHSQKDLSNLRCSSEYTQNHQALLSIYIVGISKLFL